MFPSSTHSFSMIGLLRAVGLRAFALSLIPVVLVTLEMRCRHSHSLGTLPRVVPVVSAPSKMKFGHSPVSGHTPGRWAPSPGWCL